jgi:hypothetical protein
MKKQDQAHPNDDLGVAPWPCFLCEPGVLVRPAGSSPTWVPPMTRLCNRHDAARVASGRPLADVLAARDVCQSDDWRASWLYNPVFVEGQRAWFSVAAGGFCVHGEAFPSRDACEYFAQHLADDAAELLALHRNRAVFASGGSTEGLVAHLGRGGEFKRLERLLRFRALARAFAAFKGRIDPRGSLPEEELLDRARESDALLPSFSGFDLGGIGELLDVAARRFRS